MIVRYGVVPLILLTTTLDSKARLDRERREARAKRTKPLGTSQRQRALIRLHLHPDSFTALNTSSAPPRHAWVVASQQAPLGPLERALGQTLPREVLPAMPFPLAGGGFGPRRLPGIPRTV